MYDVNVNRHLFIINFFLKYGCKAPLVEFIYTYNLKFWRNDLQNLNECIFRKAGDQNSEIPS